MRATALKLAVSAAFLVVALRGLGLGEVGDVLASADLGWVAAACAMLLVSHVVSAARWLGLLRGHGLAVGTGEALRLSFVGLFFTNVLPSGFGGDAVRTWVLGRRSQRMGDVAASVLVDRLAAVWALVVLGILAIVAAPGRIPSEVAIATGVSAFVVLGGSAILFARRPLAAMARRARPALVRRVARSAAAALTTYRDRPDLLLRAFVLALASQACVVAAAWMLARALGLDVGPLVLACVIPVALLATAVPTSINGLGVREATFRALLVPAGVSAADAVAFSLATVVAGAIVSLPGAVFWALDRRAARAEDPAAASSVLEGPRLAS